MRCRTAPPEPLKRIFVYGTLRRRSAHPMARWLASRAKWCAEAWCAGELYALGHYPGLVFGGNGRARVKGDLFCLKSTGSLARLDAYEGCAAGHYRRLVTKVMLHGAPVSAWVYVYRRPIRHRKRVRCGDWLLSRGSSPRGFARPQT